MALSRTAVAIELNTDEKQIRRIENGEVNPTLISILKICFVLKIDADEILKQIKISDDFLET